MPTEIPTLGEADLVAELEHVHRSPRRSRDTAFYGRSEVAAVRATLPDGAALYRVVRVRSELELRRALVTPRAEPLLALVTYEAALLPLDLAARLARGEVCVVSSESRLRRHLGVRHVHPDVQRLRALCEALLVDEARPASPSGASSLDLDLAWRLLLASRCGLPRDVAFTLRRLLEHLATAAPAPRWAAWLRDNPELRPVFEGWLARTVDPIAPTLWALWEEGLGRPVAALTFALGPLAGRFATDAVARMQARGWLGDLSSKLGQAVGADAAGLGRWAGAEGGLRDALRVSQGRALDLLLRDADAMVSKFEVEPSVREALAASTSLSLAWEASLQRFGEALGQCLAAPSAERFADALAPFERLRAHRNADAQSAVIDRARAALRLVAWINARAQRAPSAVGPLWQDAVDLARDYVAQGGFVDLARRDVRGSDDGAFGRACVAVEAAADALRDEDDARFAASLRHWVEAGRRGELMVPIERALDEFAARFLTAAEGRRLLVVLLDGASWANVTELLQDLDARHRHGVLRWQPTCNSASSFVAPVIATLPTITRVSRSAFFAGEVPAPGDRPDTGNDPVRFAKHARLRAVTGDVAKLHLEHDTPHVSEELRASVRSKKRAVGVVFNAIDDQLHGSRQVAVRYHVGTIKPLAELLELARASGRAILFASDHGHVTGARLGSVSSRREDGEGRCRYLDEGAAPAEGELVFRGPGVWTPSKDQRLALRTRETEAMGSTRGDGLHGGATLAEVVAPTVLVASDGLASDGDDRSLEVQSPPLPPWWELRWGAPTRRAPPQAPPPGVQPTLPHVATAPATPAAAPTPTPAKIGVGYFPSTRLGRAVLDAPSFKSLAPDRRRTLETLAVPIVDALVTHGGPMPSDMLARAVERPTWQGRSLWPTASEILNIDGYPVLDFDARTGLVKLDVPTLRLLLDLPETP